MIPLTDVLLVIIAGILLNIACMLTLIHHTLKKIQPFDPLAPTNVYGEGLSEGIQNAIVRGQRGVYTHDH